MPTITRNVSELNAIDRTAVERLVGRPLDSHQRLVIEVVNGDSCADSGPRSTATEAELPDWTDVYSGLSVAEIDDLDAAIRERANLSRPLVDLP
jgi:hypothetical protein